MASIQIKDISVMDSQVFGSEDDLTEEEIESIKGGWIVLAGRLALAGAALLLKSDTSPD